MSKVHVIPEERRLIVEKIRTERQAVLNEKKQKREKVKNFFLKNACHVNYIRHHAPRRIDMFSRGKPYGVAVSIIINGELQIGWSRVSNQDEKQGLYSRDDGILLAIDRLQPVNNYIQNESILPDVRRVIAELAYRNLLYYKGM